MVDFGSWFNHEKGQARRVRLASQTPADILQEVFAMGFDLHRPAKQVQSTESTANYFFTAKQSNDSPGLQWDKGSPWKLVQEGDAQYLELDESLLSPQAKAASMERGASTDFVNNQDAWESLFDAAAYLMANGNSPEYLMQRLQDAIDDLEA